MRELAVDAAAGDADEGPEAGAHVLRPEAAAVDASAVGRQLEEPPHDPLVPLLLLPGRGRHRLNSTPVVAGNPAASVEATWLDREAGERERDPDLSGRRNGNRFRA